MHTFLNKPLCYHKIDKTPGTVHRTPALASTLLALLMATLQPKSLRKPIYVPPAENQKDSNPTTTQEKKTRMRRSRMEQFNFTVARRHYLRPRRLRHPPGIHRRCPRRLSQINIQQIHHVALVMVPFVLGGPADDKRESRTTPPDRTLT
jgi:predicted small lipoprotein YifL